MNTTHSARRRQRPSRRTTASRAHRGTSAPEQRVRVAKPHAPGATEKAEPARSIAAEIALEEREPVKAPAQKVMRSPDADDHLAAYFRQLAEHELLTPEDERELSQGIEDTEIMTWERVFARPDVVVPLLALVEPNLETPIKFPKLEKAADDLMKAKRARQKKDVKLAKKLA